MSRHRKNTIHLQLLIAASIICFGISCVAVLTFERRNVSGIVYLLIGIIPTTVASILSFRYNARNSEKIEEIAKRTNGPLSDTHTKVVELHQKIVGE